MAQKRARPRSRTSAFARRLLRTPIAGASATVLVLLLAAAAFAPLLARYDPAATAAGPALTAPGGAYPFGTDRYGRDVFSRIVHGARVSLPIGLAAVVLSTVAGSLLGLAMGFFGGRFDAVGSRAIDIMLGFPPIMLALLIIAVLGIGITNVILAVGISGTPRFARIVRGATIGVRENVYVEAARALGGSSPRVLLRHVLPNVHGPIIVLATLFVGRAILETSSLGFLGLGVQPPIPEWGTMLSEGREFMRHAPWLMIFPGAVLFLTVVSINLLGDFLREILDPRLRGR